LSPEINKAIVRRLVEQVWNKRRVDLIEEFYSEDAVLHIAGMSSKSGLEGIRDTVNMILRAYPDLHLVIGEEIAEGAKVFNRWTVMGVPSKEVDGIPAMIKPVNRSGMAILNFSNARVTEFWFLIDNLEWMRPLRADPLSDTV
jgi:steroid delta-isomerase-like uncharacterized protein